MQTESFCYADAVGVHNYRGLAVYVAADEVRGFSADARQLCQVVDIVGNLSAEIVAEHFAHLNDVL